MIGFALVVAAATLAGGLVAGALVRRLPTLALQLGGLAVLAVLLPLVAVVATGLVMFDSGHDLTILAVAAAASSAAVAGAFALARAIGRDVEPLRRAAAALAGGDLGARAPEPATRELAALSRDFNEMAARIEELFDTRVQMVAWASHDLRTPLANMQAMIEAVEDGLAAPDEYLPALRDQTRVLGLLVDDLFELARLDAGVLTLELHDARLDGLVDSCVAGLAAEAKARRVRLETDVVAGLTVRCAPEKVERVLFNLLTNALRHTPTDGAVVVRAAREDDAVRVSVEDTGLGIEDAAGGGFGLAIVRGFIAAHGGRVSAERSAGGGARVSFTLPSG